MRIGILAVLMLFFNFAYANIGVVENVKGIVKVKSADSIRKKSVKKGSEIQKGDLLSTTKNASAVLKLSDGSNVVLDASSTILFAAENNAEQKSGKIFYKITSRDAKNSLKIKTPFAIIGIKGTTFVVNSDESNQGVALKEGLIGVASLKEEFALYRKEVLAKYNAYVSEQMNEFEKFKNAGKEPKPEMTKEFDLKAGNVISFSDNVVKESGWNEKDDAEFDRFEKMMNGDFSVSTSEDSNMTETQKDDDIDSDLEKSVPSKNRAVDAMKESMNFD